MMILHIIYIRTIHMRWWDCVYLGYDVNLADRICREAIKYYHVAYYTRLNNDSTVFYKVW